RPGPAAHLAHGHASVSLLCLGAHHRGPQPRESGAPALCGAGAPRPRALGRGGARGVAQTRHRLVRGARLARAALGPRATRGGLRRARHGDLRSGAALTMDRRAAPRFWQPDWLVLRDMARVLRGLISDPELALRG